MSCSGTTPTRAAPLIAILVSGCVALFVLSSRGAVGAVPPGGFVWEPELAPSGPVVVVISLPDQVLSAYRNGIRVAHSPISSGVKGRSTPAGVFTILEKEVTHFSNKYHHAPMPFMQRLTWEGVALHGGDLPGYPASHGCIRLPREFARRLYSLTVRGTTVIVVGEKSSTPSFTAHPGLLLASAEDKSSQPMPGEFEWNPQRSEEGPITILASGADKTVYVFRNAVLIGRATLQIDNPTQPLGSHAYTMLTGIVEAPSAFVPDRPGHQWMVVKTDSKKDDLPLADLGRRVHVSAEFAAEIYDLVTAGTTIVVTDDPASASSAGRTVRLMEEERRQRSRSGKP
jgi:hypothetical protein